MDDQPTPTPGDTATRPGSEVTVTVQIPSLNAATSQAPTTVQLHGVLVNDFEMASIKHPSVPGLYIHTRAFNERDPEPGHEPRRWTRIESATGGPFVAPGLTDAALVALSRDMAFLSATTLGVCNGSKTIKVEPMTEEGRTWVEANLTTSARKERLLARFAEFDPQAAATLEEVIDALRYEAQQDGYWGAANAY